MKRQLRSQPHCEKMMCNSGLQHGLMKGKSRLTKLTAFYKEVTSTADEKMALDVVDVDFNKAFHTVSLNNLIGKLMPASETAETDYDMAYDVCIDWRTRAWSAALLKEIWRVWLMVSSACVRCTLMAKGNNGILRCIKPTSQKKGLSHYSQHSCSLISSTVCQFGFHNVRI